MRYEAVTVPAGGGRLVRRLRSFRSEVKRFRGLIRGLQPDLVIQVTATVPAVLTAATLEHVPTVVHADEILDAGFPPHSLRAAGGEVVLRFTARSAAGICACSGPVAAQYSRRGATAVETVLPSIAPSHGGRDPAACRKALGIPANGAVVLAVGSLSHGRGQDVLLRAVSLLAARLPHLRCLIVGASHPRPQDRRFEASLRQQAAGSCPRGTVSFLGQVGDLASVYAAADVVVNPARVPESFGRVAFEAGIAGRPTVSTGVGAVGEYLRDGQSALIVPPDDPQALADATFRLLSDRALGERLAASAGRFAQAELTPERAVEGFDRLLNRVEVRGRK